MNVKTKLLAACLLATTSLNAQHFQWAKSFGGINLDQGVSICVDASGNVYTTGYFELTGDFDPGTGMTILASAGSKDVFVQKMDAFGNFLWAKAFGGTNNEIGNSIQVDASGNIYTTGYFKGTVDFDPGPGTAILTSVGWGDIFVQKMDASGNFLWAKAFGGGSGVGNSIQVDASGNVYTTGNFQGTVDFDPGAGTANLTSAGWLDIFVQKMDASGNFLWAKAFGGTGYGDEGNSIHVDAFGNVYTIGYFEGTVDFDPSAGTVNLTSAGSQDIFVQKMDASGNFLWAKSFGGTDQDRGNSICVDASGNIYTTGYFRETVDFDPGAGTANLTSAGSADIFVQKMDASGNFLWAKLFGVGGDDIGGSVHVDASGNVYTTGSFQGTVDFDPGAGMANLTSTVSGNIFVQKMDASGNFLWAKAFGKTGFDRRNSIDVDLSGNVYTTGSFIWSQDFDPGVGTAILTAAGDWDIFVQKMSQAPGGIVAIGNGIEVKAYPNPGNGLVQISFEQPLSNVTITVTDLQGKVVYTKQLTTASKEQINIEGSAGVYFLTVTTSEGQSVVKLIKE